MKSVLRTMVIYVAMMIGLAIGFLTLRIIEQVAQIPRECYFTIVYVSICAWLYIVGDVIGRMKKTYLKELLVASVLFVMSVQLLPFGIAEMGIAAIVGIRLALVVLFVVAIVFAFVGMATARMRSQVMSSRTNP